jgi:crossover junction endodeoxyribonuclease RuvC
MIIAGVDPGLGGALALYDTKRRELTAVIDMPVFKLKTKSELDPHLIAAFFKDRDIDHVFLELPQGRPGQGAYATGRFWMSYGVVLGVVVALDLVYTTVAAATWKRALGVPSEKNASRMRATQLLPGYAGFWKLVKHDGRAEAAMIAYYGALRWMPMPRRHRG